MKMEFLSYREFLPEDVAAVSRLLAEFLPADFVFRRPGTAILEEHIVGYEKTLLAEGSCSLLALLGDEIVGLVITKETEPGIRRLVLVWVEQEYRGLGIARQLLDRIIVHARRLREDLFTSSWGKNSVADAFYLSLGFEIIAVLPDRRVNGDSTVLYLKRYGKIPLEHYSDEDFLTQA